MEQFEIKKSLDVFGEIGISISELRIAGGATRSKVWNQLQADIYSIPVVKTEYEETTALGAAILACIGARIYSDPQKAVDQMVKIKTRYQPRKKLKKLYEKQYLKHKKLYQILSKSKI